ncbi:cyclin-like protein, partial [Boletus coccyginus]
SVPHFLHCADSSYTESEILLAERYVLKTIEWNLLCPNPMHFLRRISKADDIDVKARTIGKYLLEVGALEWRLLVTPSSLMAVASIWLARLILGNYKWSANLAHYSCYAESFLLPTANLMLNYILKPVRHKLFHRKYAGKRFLKVSVPDSVRTWLTWCTGKHPGTRVGTRAMRGEYASVLEGRSPKAESSLPRRSSTLGRRSREWRC